MFIDHNIIHAVNLHEVLVPTSATSLEQPITDEVPGMPDMADMPDMPVMLGMSISRPPQIAVLSIHDLLRTLLAAVYHSHSDAFEM